MRYTIQLKFSAFGGTFYLSKKSGVVGDRKFAAKFWTRAAADQFMADEADALLLAVCTSIEISRG